MYRLVIIDGNSLTSDAVNFLALREGPALLQKMTAGIRKARQQSDEGLSALRCPRACDLGLSGEYRGEGHATAGEMGARRLRRGEEGHSIGCHYLSVTFINGECVPSTKSWQCWDPEKKGNAFKGAVWVRH